jgi:hypothetical protein
MYVASVGTNPVGTDINLHAEARSGGIWRYCGELNDFEDQNYEFFAIVANVKNPIRSTHPFDYIALPRGLPADMSLLFSGHDAGWVTLRELLDFDWDGKTMLRSAVVDPKIAPLFGDGNQRFPKDRITGPYGLADGGPGPRVTWLDTYKEAVGAKFLTGLFEALGRFGRPEDVRIVFSFDS